MQQRQMLRERDRLQEIVERVNWVYAGLWQLSQDHRWVVWEDGYYSGPPVQGLDTLVPVSVPSKQRSFRRKLLKELQAGSTDLISLSNLSSTEWFYLASSSFSFPVGSQGTPAKMLMTGGFQWVSNAGEVDPNTFSRSELAKAAGMQTVLCLAVHGGVVELGTTTSVDENIQLVQFIRAVFEKGEEIVNPPTACSGKNRCLTFGTASSMSPISISSKTNLQNGPMSVTHFNTEGLGQDMGMVPNAYKNFGWSPVLSNPLVQGNHIGQTSGLEVSTIPTSLVSGMIHGHLTDSVEVQHNYSDNIHVHQQLSPRACNLSFEQQHMMRGFQAQSDTALLANPKHRLPSPYGGQVLAPPQSNGDSCMACLERALSHPQPPNSICHKGASLPLDLTAKLLLDFQMHLCSHGSRHFVQLQNNQQVPLEQGNNMFQSPSGAQTVGSSSVAQISPAASLVDSVKPSDAQWWTHKHGSNNISSTQRKLHFKVEGGTLFADEVLAVVGECSNKLASPSIESHHLSEESANSSPHTGFLQAPIESNTHPQFVVEHHSHTSCVKDNPWSRPGRPTISDITRQEAEGVLLCGNVDRMKKASFFDYSSTSRQKRARGRCDGTENSHEEDNAENGLRNNQVNHNLDEKNLLDEDYQVLIAMVNKNYPEADRASVLEHIINLVEELQCRVKDTTTSSAPWISYSSSCTSSSLGRNEVNHREEYNHQAIQQPCGRGRVCNAGYVKPLLKLPDVCLGSDKELNRVVLGVVDGIPQIEVRTMENANVIIKLSSKSQPGLFTDIMFVLQDLQLEVQDANIRTVSGVGHDVFAAKVNASMLEKQATSVIVEAIRQAIEKGNMSS